ncbi:MAG: UbiA family prenyltransferase [Pseudomonadota bacterium]
MTDAAMSDTDCPLVVDLDGTLVRSDLLHEGLLRLVADQPTKVLSLNSWLAGGKAVFKRHLAEAVTPDIGSLPYDPDILRLLENARGEGRRVALVTASDQAYADQVADHLGLFDEVHGSDGVRNLGGEEKAAFLVERFGRAGFDYIGDSKTDLPVWAEARHALIVSQGHELPAKPAGQVVRVETGRYTTKSLVRALRPHQWLKNSLIALPMFAAFQFEPLTIWAVMLAFACFSLTASGVYVVNDLLDLPADRRHPRKRKRPFAAGDVPIKIGVITAGLLWAVAGLMALLLLPGAFCIVLLIYFAITFAYSLGLKKKAVVDICTLAALYSLRIIAGGAATGIVISPWLLAFAMFLFLALAAIKRQAEMTDLEKTDPTRVTGRPYQVEDLPIIRSIAMSAGYSAVLVMALYINSATALARFPLPEALWLICPLLLYWMTRMVMVTHHGRMTDDPIVFTLSDKVSWAVATAILFVIMIARIGL